MIKKFNGDIDWWHIYLTIMLGVSSIFLVAVVEFDILQPFDEKQLEQSWINTGRVQELSNFYSPCEFYNAYHNGEYDAELTPLMQAIVNDKGTCTDGN